LKIESDWVGYIGKYPSMRRPCKRARAYTSIEVMGTCGIDRLTEKGVSPKALSLESEYHATIMIVFELQQTIL